MIPEKFLLPALCAALLFVLGCSGNQNETDPPENNHVSTPLESCLEGEILTQAEQTAGMTGEATAIAPIGRALTPVGKLVTVGRWALAGAFSPDGLHAYVVHNGERTLKVLDSATGDVIQTVDGVGGFRGILVMEDGSVLTADGSMGTVTRLVPGEDGLLSIAQTRELPGVPTSLIRADGNTVIVLSGLNSRIWELDGLTLEVLTDYMSRGTYPYDGVVSKDGKHLVVTHVGDDKVTRILRSSGELVDHIPVDHNPMGILLDGKRDRIYVLNSDSDTLSVISATDFTLLDTVDMSGIMPGVPGGSPNEIVMTPDGDSILVSFADLNFIGRYSLPDFQPTGAIPTGFYPTGMAFSPDGKLLLTVSSKGWGAIDTLHSWKSFVNLVPIPEDDATWKAWQDQAFSNVLRPLDFYNESSCSESLPLPLDPGKEPVINHVVMIVRENKTYDAVFGDMEGTNADPALLVFGEEFTPNLHSIAREFVNMDNFYSDPESSFQGHTWTTQADCNDFFEKVYPATASQILLGGYDPSSIHNEKSFFDHCFVNGVTFRNYGEFESFTKELFGEYEQFLNQKFPFYNLSIPDVWKAGEFVRELELGIFPQFVYIALPNDHTAGGKDGMPTPASMVADNDEATGMVVDAISNSPFWDSTIIFIIEDDPQGYGGDHVHSHRSVCVVASPWVKRNHVSSVLYSIPSIYRTIEMILRLEPMNKNTALAAPMLDIFIQGSDAQPDSTPFEGIPRLIPVELNKPDGPMARESENIDISHPDGCEGLGEIIWKIMKGDVPPPPYARWTDD